MGQFETGCLEIPTSQGANDFSVCYWNLPFMFQVTLMLSGTNGIIGFDFFNNFKVILDVGHEKLLYAGSIWVSFTFIVCGLKACTSTSALGTLTLQYTF